MDWANPIPLTGETQSIRPVPQIASELTKESEDDMSSLAIGFSAWMHKRATSTYKETIPGSEVPGNKRPKRFGLYEDVHKSLIVVTFDSKK